jgi:hypothetical protein
VLAYVVVITIIIVASMVSRLSPEGTVDFFQTDRNN